MTDIPIKGASLGTPEQAYIVAVQRGAKRIDFLRDYLDALYADCKTLGIRADVLVAQADLETGAFTSTYWTRDGNPAGIAAFDDGSNWGLTFSPQKAARGHTVHMACYIGITDLPAGWRATDARWQAAVDAGYLGSVTATADLGNGRWATDPKYAEKLISRHAAYGFTTASQPSEQEPTMALNFDPALVPMPPYEHRWALNKKDGHGQSNFGTRVHRGISWHRGVTGNQTLDNAVGYLIAASTAGLTDGYIDNVTGRLVFMNPMEVMFEDLPAWWEDRAGWANGPYQSSVAAPDAKAFVAKYGGRIGASIVNQDLESFEVLGNYGTSISDECKRTMVQIGANRAQRKKIPWDSYPINPHTGLTEIYGHREFCGTDYKECPGSVVWAFINGDYITMVRDILKKAQTAGQIVQPAPVVPAPAPEIVIPQPDINLMAELFGGADGFAYDPKGVVTAAWMDEGEKSGLFPRLLETIVDDSVRSFVFSSGLVLQNEIGTGNVTRLDAA